jgi:predicted RND superfamily exporter protein
MPRDLRALAGRYLARGDGRELCATIVYARRGVRADALAPALVQLGTEQVRVRVTGASAAGEQMAALLRRDLLVISGTTLGAVLLLLAALVRRAWPIVATLLSLLLAGVLFAAALRLLGLEMDLYNLMVIPIIIGYGVDDHLYLVHRSLRQGLRVGVVEGGRPVLAATLSTMAAFAVLGFCRLPGLHTLGLTGTLGLGLGLVASLVVMPALLSLAPSYRDV